MKNPFISIVIPCYNGISSDIDVCLKSIWAQPLSSDIYEVICVDDCSTDTTREYLDNERLRHSNLKVIYNSINLRQGGSRNNGIKEAKGEYIMFIDQDDYYHVDIFAALYTYLLQNLQLDVLMCDSAWQIKGTENNQLQHNFSCTGIMTGVEFIKANGGIVYAPWKYIVRKTFLQDNNLYFSDKTRIEDIDWSLKLVYHAQKMQYQPFLLIHYNRGEGSTTWDILKSPETIFDTIKCGLRVFALSNNLGNDEAVRRIVCNIADFYVNRGVIFMCGVFISKKEKLAVIEKMKNINSKYKIIRFAQKYPKCFVFISNSTPPIVKIMFYMKRFVKFHVR